MLQVLLFGLASLLQGDSLRMEIINGKPHVVHQVGEKETLYSLSKRYGTTVADILTENPTADAGLEVGQILKIPYVGKAKAPVTVKTSEGIVHRVATKETLFSIARHYNVSVDDIRTWNNLKENSISVGQEILIKQKPEGAIVEVAKPVAVATAAKTHTVAPKETLYSIARQYGMTVTQLKEWNSIPDNELRIGQVLSVAAPIAATTSSPLTAPSTPVTASSTPVSAVATPIGTSAVISPSEPARISEGLSGANELRETGMAALLEGTDGNRKYLAQHATIKPGTILKIRNLATNQEVFVRVIGQPTTADATTLIYISKSAYDRLGAVENKFRAEITYYK
jgi:LysM repeat protein